MEYFIDDKGLHIGSKTYIGEAINKDITEIGLDKYNIKIKHYANNKKIITYCSTSIFRIPLIKKKKVIKKYSATSFYNDSEYREQRLDSLLRSKNRLKDIVLLNEFEYFATFTFDISRVDSTDIQDVIRKTQVYLKNAVQRNDLKYIVVPEYHADGKKVHLHALLSGNVPVKSSGTFKCEGIKKPMKMSTIKKKGLCELIVSEVYNIANWHYGFSTAIKIYGSVQALSSYVTKYLTKDNHKIFGKFYWCSKNLNLYPVEELANYPCYKFKEIAGREYWNSSVQASFKYENRLGDSIDD